MKRTFLLCLFLAVATACSQTPVQPTAGQSSAAAPSPSPTPDAACECTSVTVTFDPGGATPTWGVYAVSGNGTNKSRVGFRLDVKCTGKGQSNKCTVLQIEKGKLTWTVGGDKGEIVGKETEVKSFPNVKIGDNWEKGYSDALGADYPRNSTDTMTVNLDMEFEIKCVSSDGQTKSQHFKIVGSVDAKAPSKGAKPTLTNATLTLTPLP